MSVLFRIANAAGRIGLTPWVARVASLAYRGSDFSVDDHGRWVNRQAEATFVSPVFHTKSYAAVNEWVLDHWTWGYLPRAGDTVIDVGAGIGEEAVIFSRLVGESGRVISIEATDIRALDPMALAETPDFATVDVSFISLKLVLPALDRLLRTPTELVALIKPQFEAGPKLVKKGIVRDPAVHTAVCEEIAVFSASLGWKVAGVIPSPVEGGEGNREFLLGATKV